MKRRHLLIGILILPMLSCTSGPDKKEVDSAYGAGNALMQTEESVDSAALREEAERLRIDSLTANALRGDSLKEKHIVVDKQALMLYLRENSSTIVSYPICVGQGIGQKQRRGDHKTPEGNFKIISVEDARGYLHDFHDGKGKVKGAYGNWFLRLNTPQSTHIGIHGTLFPESMGKRESDGCVRMRNEDLDSLQRHVFVGMKVIINPEPEKQ